MRLVRILLPLSGVSLCAVIGGAEHHVIAENLLGFVGMLGIIALIALAAVHASVHPFSFGGTLRYTKRLTAERSTDRPPR